MFQKMTVWVTRMAMAALVMSAELLPAAAAPVALTAYVAVDVSRSVIDERVAASAGQRIAWALDELREMNWRREDVIVPMLFAGKAIVSSEPGPPRDRLNDLHRRVDAIMAAKEPAKGKLLDEFDACRTSFAALWKAVGRHHKDRGSSSRDERRVLTLIISDGEDSPTTCDGVRPDIPAMPPLQRSSGEVDLDWLSLLIVRHSGNLSTGKESRWRSASGDRQHGPRFRYEDVADVPKSEVQKRVRDVVEAARSNLVPEPMPGDAKDLSRPYVLSVVLDVRFDITTVREPHSLVVDQARLVPMVGRGPSIPVTLSPTTTLLTGKPLRVEARFEQELGDQDYSLEFTYRIVNASGQAVATGPGNEKRAVRARVTTFTLHYYPPVILRPFGRLAPEAVTRDIEMSFHAACSDCSMRLARRSFAHDGVVALEDENIQAFEWAPVRLASGRRVKLRFVVEAEQSGVKGADFDWVSIPPRTFKPSPAERGSSEPLVLFLVLVGLPAVLNSLSWLFAYVPGANLILHRLLTPRPDGSIPRPCRWLRERWLITAYTSLLGIGGSAGGARLLGAGVGILVASMVLHAGPLVALSGNLWMRFVSPYYIGVLGVGIVAQLILWRLDRQPGWLSTKGLWAGLWMMVEVLTSTSPIIGTVWSIINIIWVYPTNEVSFAWPLVATFGVAALPLLALARHGHRAA